MKDTIWRDETNTWFFLIPQADTLPPGDFPIYTLLGRSQMVDPDTIEGFLVPREYAEAYLSGEISDTLQGIKDALLGWVRRTAYPPVPNLFERRRDTAKRARTIALMADLMGESPDALRHDSRAATRGFKRIGQGIERFMDSVRTGDEDAARAQILDVCDVLRARGIDIRTKDR